MAIFIDGDYYCETHNIRMTFDGNGGESCPICADHTEKIIIPKPQIK